MSGSKSYFYSTHTKSWHLIPMSGLVNGPSSASKIQLSLASSTQFDGGESSASLSLHHHHHHHNWPLDEIQARQHSSKYTKNAILFRFLLKWNTKIKFIFEVCSKSSKQWTNHWDNRVVASYFLRATRAETISPSPISSRKSTPLPVSIRPRSTSFGSSLTPDILSNMVRTNPIFRIL